MVLEKLGNSIRYLVSRLPQHVSQFLQNHNLQSRNKANKVWVYVKNKEKITKATPAKKINLSANHFPKNFSKVIPREDKWKMPREIKPGKSIIKIPVIKAPTKLNKPLLKKINFKITKAIK